MAFTLPFGQLNSFIGSMQNAAAGRGPSAAERLLRQTSNTQNAQTMGQAMSQRGPQTQGLALRNAQRINMQRQAGTNAQASALRASEQSGARGMLAPLLQQQQAAQLAGVGGAIDTVNAGQGSGASWLGAGATMLPLLLSDERRKRIINRAPTSAARRAGEEVGNDAGNAITRFLRSIRPTQFQYDTEAPDAPVRTGMTAQDAMRTPEGRAMVVNTPEGAALDTTQMAGMNTAALSQHQGELEQLRRDMDALRTVYGQDVADLEDEAAAEREVAEDAEFFANAETAVEQQAREGRRPSRGGPAQRPPRSTAAERMLRQRERVGASGPMNQAELDDADRQHDRLSAGTRPPLAFAPGAVTQIVRGAMQGQPQVTPAQRALNSAPQASRAPGTQHADAQRRAVRPFADAARRAVEAARALGRKPSPPRTRRTGRGGY